MKKLSNFSFKKSITKARTDLPLGSISVDPSLVLVCDSKTGSITFILTAATIPCLMSTGSYLLKKSLITLATASLKAL